MLSNHRNSSLGFDAVLLNGGIFSDIASDFVNKNMKNADYQKVKYLSFI
ncbi:hypothetical protein MuYL_0804 [Mucilaginibacter xinganensis]|uniref:Uncharacterized protein n=1 Tax=Mucilaginibacter xinganensis TaxID=1234841 RepID=A0A223NSQ7_9SPHI|nr:hypothetical protein MuYL_0804 [Mucilaginibacter xinganensis]